MPSTSISMALHPWSLSTVGEHGLPGHMVQYKNATGTVLEVLRILHVGCHYQRIPGI